MTNEFVGFSERLLKRNGAGVGGVDDGVVIDVRGVLGRFLDLGRRAAGDGEDEEVDEVMEDECTSIQAITHPTTYDPHPLNDQGTIQITETFDPYINTIWSSNPTLTDNSIVPYILSGRDSFASRLYFDTITLAVRSLRGDDPFDFAASIFRYKLPYCTRSDLFKIIAGILEMLLLGTNKIPPGANPQTDFPDVTTGHNIPCNATAIVAETIHAENLNEEEYLSTWQVETYIKDRWGIGLDSNAVRIQRRPEEALCPIKRDRTRPDYESVMFAPTLLPGFWRDSQIILSADGLVERLKVRCITLGAGPRWHVDAIEEAIVEFFEENRERIIEVV